MDAAVAIILACTALKASAGAWPPAAAAPLPPHACSPTLLLLQLFVANPCCLPTCACYATCFCNRRCLSQPTAPLTLRCTATGWPSLTPCRWSSGEQQC